ncbi:MAG: LTA synthase family protein [Proteobacteria bacterium]|nr:LTA synthase family protein [Pseudomonadota bacterium]
MAQKKLNEVFIHYAVQWFMACLAGFVLTLALFLRPTPYGLPYVLDLSHYLPHAVFYMIFGLTVLIMPFLFYALICRPEKRKYHGIGSGLFLMFSLLFGHADNEVLRYISVHITPDFLQTYLMNSGIPVTIWAIFRDDLGGANLSLWLLGVPPLFLIVWFVSGRRLSSWLYAKLNASRCIQCYGERVFIFVLIITFIALPFLFRSSLFGSKNRQAKVAPPIILIADFISEWNEPPGIPDNYDELASLAQQHWLKHERDPHWIIPDPAKPFRKTYSGTCLSQNASPLNVVLISFESFRAKSIRFLNPEETADATPFLRSLAQSDLGAYYTRYYTNGHPTIAAFMAIHTGLLPHSKHTVAKHYTSSQFQSFASIMREHGYHTAFFAGSDPDWDNQRAWLMRWYDDIIFNPKFNEQDRLIMQDVVRYLRDPNHTSRPFLVTAFLISNHQPFRLREEAFRLNAGKTLSEAILNTMYYDDDVLREFFEAIKDEPWFKNTVFIITGDHGTDLGDRGKAPSYENLRREVTQMPLVIYGHSPNLPRGLQTTLASHIDLAPTILDMVNICASNAFMGHSLLHTPSSDRHVAIIKQGNFALETLQHSAYFPAKGPLMLFHADDLWQVDNVAETYKTETDFLHQYIRDLSVVVDVGYRLELYSP